MRMIGAVLMFDLDLDSSNIAGVVADAVIYSHRYWTSNDETDRLAGVGPSAMNAAAIKSHIRRE